jgi:hypothetical protein
MFHLQTNKEEKYTATNLVRAWRLKTLQGLSCAAIGSLGNNRHVKVQPRRLLLTATEDSMARHRPWGNPRVSLLTGAGEDDRSEYQQRQSDL